MTSLTDEEIDAGYDYIIKAPRTDENLRQTRWVSKSLKNDTPIKGWPVGLVLSALKSVMADGCLSKKHTSYPCTLLDVEEWFLTKVIARFWGQIKRKALVILGPAGCCKTPIASVIGLAVAEFWAEQMDGDCDPPCFRLASDLDFLRGVVGTKTCVDIVDDADSDTLPIKKSRRYWTSGGNVKREMQRYQVGPRATHNVSRQQIRCVC